MSSPLHRHDCTRCRFVTSVGKIDVYTCGNPATPGACSLIARFSDGPSDNASTCLKFFTDSIKNNERIELMNGKVMSFRDYLASEHVINYHKAWLIALPLIG